MTDPAQVVARQLDSGASILMLALEPLDDGEFFAENPDGLSAAWTAGHVSCFTDLFSSWFDGRKILSAPFHQVFNNTGITAPGLVSKAAGADRDIYPKSDLLLSLRLTVTKALRALADFGNGPWDDPAPPGVPVSLRTGGAAWEVLAAHIPWHCGALAGSMPRFRDTYTLNVLPHHFYVPETPR